jgi:4-carboxymuconolactone decarboxylase
MPDRDTTRRLAPLPPERWDERTRELLAATLAPVGKLEGAAPARPLNILTVIAHHPTLLGPFLELARALALDAVLPRRSSELLALRAAWNCRSAFEWGHHALYGKAAGLADEEIARIAAGPEAPGWDDADRLLLCAADELHRDQSLSDATWAALQRRHDEAAHVEIPFVVGQYTLLSMVANATGVPLEDHLPPLPTAGGAD